MKELENRYGQVETDIDGDIKRLKGIRSWDAVYSGSNINGIAFGNGIFIIGGNSLLLKYSSDGEKWNNCFDNLVENDNFKFNINILMSSGTEFIAYDSAGGSNAHHYNILDFTNPGSSCPMGYVNNIYGNNGAYCPGYGFSIFPPNGWVIGSGTSSATWNDWVYRPTNMTANVGSYYQLTDGTTGRVCGYGSNGGFVTYTGIDNLGQNTAKAIKVGNSLTSIAYGNGKYIALESSSGSGWKSSDGDNWEAISIPGSNGRKIIFAKNIFVVTGIGKLYTSYNGDSWSTITLPFNESIIGLAYGNDMIFAISSNHVFMCYL